MKMESVYASSFRRYGQVLEGYDFGCFLEKLSETPCPHTETVYEPSCPVLEELSVSQKLQKKFYGDMPIQIGYCNGHNSMLNCLEYHRDSEVNVFVSDAVLLLASREDLQNFQLDTAKVKAFLVPAGTAIEVFGSTLHYAPCGVDPQHDFRMAVILPRGTNYPMELPAPECEEEKLLWARNKWLIAHREAPEAKAGAYVGLIGDNIDIWR